jgi:xanthine dehydrogenase accessory factor
MHELEAILKAFEESQKNDETTFLATVVNTKGSTYRQPGARMLITSEGRTVGTISGGCLEKDIFEYARLGIRADEPIVVRYDTTSSEDIVWGFGLGCNGVVEVLIERIDCTRQLNPMVFFAQCLLDRQPRVIATVFAVNGLLKVKVGARLILNPDSSISTDIIETNLTEAIAQDAKLAKKTQLSTLNKYQLSSGSVEVFIEVIQPPTPLLVFGAGPDALPVVRFAKTLGWQTTVIDCRALETTRERFLIADKIILTRRQILQQEIVVNSSTVAVVMTHNYLDDLEIIKLLLPSPACYIGILGAKHRSERLLLDLHTEKLNYTKDQFQRLHAPIGIDIGANTPEEIALAIVAEIQAVLTNRSGGFLKNCKEPLHQRCESKNTQIECLEKLLT